jgi:hypothetical protein
MTAFFGHTGSYRGVQGVVAKYNALAVDAGSPPAGSPGPA